jgi:hypothetical protein
LVKSGVKLEDVINEYKEHYSENHEVLRTLNNTLARLISYIKTGEANNYSFYHKLEDAGEKDLVESLTTALKQWNAFTLDNYIKSYLETKAEESSEEYLKYKDFFRIDFDKVPEFMEEREEEEGLEPPYSYKHLFNFLHQQLIPCYISNNSRHLYPQMGMAPNVEALIRKNIPFETYDVILHDSEKRKEALYNLIKETIEVVFLHKDIILQPQTNP